MKLDVLKKLFDSVWLREEIYKEYFGEKMFLVKKDYLEKMFLVKKIYLAFSDRKMKRVDQHLPTEEYERAHQCWDDKEKIIPFEPPQSPEGETDTEASHGVRLLTVKVLLDKQKSDLRSEMVDDLKKTQDLMLQRQSELNKQLIEGLVNNLRQMFQSALQGLAHQQKESQI